MPLLQSPTSLSTLVTSRGYLRDKHEQTAVTRNLLPALRRQFEYFRRTKHNKETR